MKIRGISRNMWGGYDNANEVAIMDTRNVGENIKTSMREVQ